MVDLSIELPSNFLDEEIRCDYLVTKKMKEVWAVELDLLFKVLSVCKENNIRVCSFAGTTLGAIRHRGMIPWDDDIDLCMDRDNYIKFAEIANKVFQYPYFFQTEYTDPGSLRGHAQIRRTDTTGILEIEYKTKRKFNQGIFIDIFPLDDIPDSLDDENRFRKEIYCLQKKAYITSLSWKEYITSTSFIRSIVKSFYYPIMKIISKTPRYYYNRMEILCEKYHNYNFSRVAPISFAPLDVRWTMEKTDLDEIDEIDFEFIKIPIPRNYDKILKQQYGDYMKLVKGKAVHSGLILDASISYLKYLEDKK